MKFRDYQHDAIDAVFREWQTVRSTLVQGSVGIGKTIIMAGICKRAFPRRVLVVAHRKELIDQAADKIRRATGYEVDIEMAEHRARVGADGKPVARIVVATVQTLTTGGDGGRLTRFHPTHFDVILTDECHRSLSVTYRRIYDYFSLNPNMRMVGVTATPDRSDGKAMAQVFESVAYQYPMVKAINDGWLVPVRQQIAHVASLDISGVSTVAGDLNPAELAPLLQYERTMLEMADPIVQLGGDNRRGIIFTASVEQAERMAEILNRYKPGSAAWLCAKTPKDDRSKIRTQFSNGDVQWVANMGIWTEGFDDAGVDDVFMCRPTKSRSLYEQMAGRAVRPHDSIAHHLGDHSLSVARKSLIASSPKPYCRIIDFSAQNAGRHKLITSIDILGGDMSEEVKRKVKERVAKSGKAIDVKPMLEEEEQRIMAEREKKRLAAEAKRAKLRAKVEYSLQDVDPFDVLGIRHVTNLPSQPRFLKQTQIDMLLRAGVNPDRLNYREAGAICREIIMRYKTGRCTYKMAKILVKHGLDPHMQMEPAKKALDRIFAEKRGEKEAVT